jgi:hypothetical protein
LSLLLLSIDDDGRSPPSTISTAVSGFELVVTLIVIKRPVHCDITPPAVTVYPHTLFIVVVVVDVVIDR